MKVLIVDDSSAVRMMLAQSVRETEGMELVGEADFVAHAIEQFRRLKPDLVLLDAQLPDGYGLDVLRVIKEEMPDCLVAMVSSYPLLYEEISRREGADYFVAKLAGLESIGHILREIAASHSPSGLVATAPVSWSAKPVRAGIR